MARTAVVVPPPIQTTGLPSHPDLYSIREDGDDSDDAHSPSSPRTAYSFMPQTPPSPRTMMHGRRTPPTVLNSPRKLSNSSTTSTMFSRESARSELQRNSSWSTTSATTVRTSFESWDSGQWKPVDFEAAYRSPSSPLSRRPSAPPPAPDEILASLPDEVLDLILDMLKALHLEKNPDSGAVEGCATCWMRDLCSLSLVSRRWCTRARTALYSDIQLVGADSSTHRKRFRINHGARLMLLRRTLRSDLSIARLVRSLKVPRPDPKLKGFNTKALEQYEDLTASVVMACPNLERLSGAQTTYNHSFKKTFHALSTRSNLKEMHWLIETLPKPARQKSDNPQDDTLDTSHEDAFLDLHRRWANLSCMSIRCLPGAAITPDSLLTRTLSMLPSLQHLHLSNLPASAFNDATLLSLPPLQTLSLTHMAGITAKGLSSLATLPSSHTLQTLHLRHTPLTSLAALARILSNLTNLGSFSLCQTFPPLMPEDDNPSYIWMMMPYLASPALRSLHWDITSHRDCANVADDILARSIAAGGFPSLRVLRCPNDPDALFQNLCRPLDRIDLPTDRFCVSDMITTTPSTPPALSSPGFLLSLASPRSTSSSPFPTLPPPAPCTDLRIARLSAQTRLEKARARPRFCITVSDENGDTVEEVSLGGYLGTLGSRINYHLLPDLGSADARGGAVDVSDLSGDAGETIDGHEGCTGAWNRPENAGVAKASRDRWSHTERGRWRRIELR